MSARRNDPRYHLWTDRKGDRVPRWDSWANFIDDVGERPFGDVVLVKLRDDQPYGPENYRWLLKSAWFCALMGPKNELHRYCKRGHVLAGSNRIMRDGPGTGDNCAECKRQYQREKYVPTGRPRGWNLDRDRHKG